jgi:hypothetical protein
VSTPHDTGRARRHDDAGRRGGHRVAVDVKSLSADFNLNAIKHTYDYSCFLELLDEYQHLMTLTSTPSTGPSPPAAAAYELLW